MLDTKNLQLMIDEKYISVQPHPSADLYIFNYTQKAQFDRVWNNETLQCRGLIMDSKNNVIARPFKKFFNLSEIEENGGQLPLTDFEVFDKLDGSLGILYWVNDTPYLATRGSFISDQAIKGTQILHTKYAHFFESLNRNFTYLFEIIYPQNRIVVNYGELEDLFLLTVVDTQTGEELLYEQMLSAYGDTFHIVRRYDGIEDYHTLQGEQLQNAEGYVIRFKDNSRVKLKFDEYVRLHRLVTGVNARSIWDLLRHKQDFNELLDRVPDEFYSWVSKTKQELINKYIELELEASKVYQEVKNLPTRKEQAVAVFQVKRAGRLSAIVFKMLDDKSYDEIIWKQLKPVAEKPFKEEI